LHFSPKYTIPEPELVIAQQFVVEFSEGDETMTVKQTQPTIKQQGAMYVMIGKQMASSYPWWAMLIAFVVGLLVGWMVLGWGLWPVQWSQAKPSSLSNQPSTNPAENRTYMWSYLNFAATTYGTNSMSIEETAKFLGEGWTVQEITAVLDQMITANYAQNRVYLEKFKNDLNIAVQTGKAQSSPHSHWAATFFAATLFESAGPHATC
jgi:hypothetical protein